MDLIIDVGDKFHTNDHLQICFKVTFNACVVLVNLKGPQKYQILVFQDFNDHCITLNR